jgi:hypothetical protein
MLKILRLIGTPPQPTCPSELVRLETDKWTIFFQTKNRTTIIIQHGRHRLQLNYKFEKIYVIQALSSLQKKNTGKHSSLSTPSNKLLTY